MFEPTFKNFKFNFNTPNGSDIHRYSNGSQLTGHISFDLTKETKITAITMTLKGMVHVHWSTGGGKNRRHFSAKVVFLDYHGTIMQETVTSAQRLQPGTHLYPFTCIIPQGDFPSSFQGVHGQITYTFTVGIKRPWHLNKDFVSALNFVSHIDTNIPDLWAPLSGINTKTVGCLWCTSGLVTMKASVEKKAYNPGETVKIMCHFSNTSSKTVTPTVKLEQKQGYRLHDGVERRRFVKNLASAIGDSIGPHTTNVYTEFTLQIPPFTPLTITNCSLLEVSYTIEVSVKIRLSWDLVILIPIILYDSPVYGPPQPSL